MAPIILSIGSKISKYVISEYYVEPIDFIHVPVACSSGSAGPVTNATNSDKKKCCKKMSESCVATSQDSDRPAQEGFSRHFWLKLIRKIVMRCTHKDTSQHNPQVGHGAVGGIRTSTENWAETCNVKEIEWQISSGFNSYSLTLSAKAS